jgi:transposase
VELPADHHCPWRELAESMEQRFGAIIAQQQKLIEEQQAVIRRLTREHEGRVLALETEVARLTRELVGRKSEKVKIPPIERELAAKEPPSEAELAARREEIEKKRRARALAKDAVLATEDVEHRVPDEMKTCSACGGALTQELPAETSSTIDYVPGRFVKRRHRRQKLACRCGGCIVTAPPPPRLIEGGHYGPGFAAFLVVEKCADSIPIYRVEKRFARLGIPISRSTMNDIIHVAAEVVRPLVARLTTRISDVEIVLADETSVRLQTREKRGFIWVFHGRDEHGSGGELVLYVFATDRSGETPMKILGGSVGALVVDGYTGYNNITDPAQRERAGCWCHARRKFFEAQSTAPAEAKHAIDEIRRLFRVEHEATLAGIVGTDAHLALRAEKSKPILDKLFEWLVETKPNVLPKSPIAAAITYAINQKERLQLFLRDARLPLHNNSSESRLRVIALGRKNYLFFGHPRAGRNFAGLYSLVASCVANNIEPTAYLTDVLTRIRDDMTSDEVDAILPDRWSPRA